MPVIVNMYLNVHEGHSCFFSKNLFRIVFKDADKKEILNILRFANNDLIFYATSFKIKSYCFQTDSLVGLTYFFLSICLKILTTIKILK